MKEYPIQISGRIYIFLYFYPPTHPYINSKTSFCNKKSSSNFFYNQILQNLSKKECSQDLYILTTLKNTNKLNTTNIKRADTPIKHAPIGACARE